MLAPMRSKWITAATSLLRCRKVCLTTTRLLSGARGIQLAPRGCLVRNTCTPPHTHTTTPAAQTQITAGQRMAPKGERGGAS